MTTKINRRDFLKSGALITTAALFGATTKINFAHSPEGINSVNIAVVKGSDRFKNTKKAVQLLGGMKKFLPANATIGLLPNSPSWWKNPGSYTHPDIVLATILMCLEAGVKELRYLIDPAGNFWQRTSLSEKYKKETTTVIKCSGNYIDKKIPRGKSLKKVKIIKDLFQCDAYINLPIIKNHAGTNMSCSLKNLMGANTHESNRFFHHGSGSKDSYGDVEFLSQCVADLNTLRKPVLCIVDASEVLSTNGPGGPGKIIKPQRVVAGTDPVAIDAYCSTLLGLDPQDIIMINRAHQQGLGVKDTSRLKVKEVRI